MQYFYTTSYKQKLNKGTRQGSERLSTYKSKVATSNRARAEALHAPIGRFVPIAKGLRAFAVRSILADGAHEHVPDRIRRNKAGGPDLPVCNGRRRRMRSVIGSTRQSRVYRTYQTWCMYGCGSSSATTRRVTDQHPRGKEKRMREDLPGIEGNAIGERMVSVPFGF